MSGNAANFPATANALGKIIQTTDGNYTETYQIPNTPGPYTHLLGKNLTPPLPTGWQDVPLGAYPINPPGAVTLGSPAAFNSTAGFMTTGGVYKVAMTNVTDYGETVAGSISTFTLSAPNTATNYTLPAVSQGTADAPIRKRRLYRSVAGGSSLFLVAEISDLAQVSYVDGLADIYLLTPPPSVNGSGAIGSVLVSGGGHAGGYWTEVAPGTGLVGGQYIVDYSTGTTGGTITHAAADANLASVQAQFTAGTLASATVVNNIIQALQDMAAANAGAIPTAQKATNNGVPSLNSSGHVVQDPARSFRQVIPQNLFTTPLSLVASTTMGAFGNGFAITTSGGNVTAEMSLGLVHTGTDTGQSIEFYITWTGPTSGSKLLGTINGYALPQNGRTQLYLGTDIDSLPAGTYTFSFEYSSGIISGWTTQDGFNICWGKITEYA